MKYRIAKTTEVSVETTEVGQKTTEVGVKTPEVGPKASEVGVKTPEVGQKTTEVSPKTTEVGPKNTEVGQKTSEVGQKTSEVGQKPDFDTIMKNYRKDFRETCANVWECLAADATLSRKAIAVQLKIAESSVQSATNALQEVGLLEGKGRGKGKIWIVRTMPDREGNQS